MKIVLDTSGYCASDLGSESALDALETADQIFLPSVAYGELYYGFKNGSRFSKNATRLDGFIKTFAIQIIAVDLDVARIYGDIFAFLKSKGKPIPTNDIWIAASCLSVGGLLLTSDQHFRVIDTMQLRLV